MIMQSSNSMKKKGSNSIRHHGLDISRAAFTRGTSTHPCPRENDNAWFSFELAYNCLQDIHCYLHN